MVETRGCKSSEISLPFILVPSSSHARSLTEISGLAKRLLVEDLDVVRRNEPGGFAEISRGLSRAKRGDTPGLECRNPLHPGRVPESCDYERRWNGLRLAGWFWHPSGVRFVCRRRAGGVASAQPPANVWQPSGLPQRPLRADGSGDQPELKRRTHQFVSFILVNLSFHRFCSISVD
jgi:hypothetical protein